MAALAWQLAACASTATIRRFGEPPLEAQIVDSDANALLVGDETGGTAQVRRPVIDIDHPGNVLALAGVGLLLLGASLVTSEHQTGGEAVATGLVVGTPALLMIGWGGSRYLRSKQAADRFERETVRLRTPDPDRPYLPAPRWTR